MMMPLLAIGSQENGPTPDIEIYVTTLRFFSPPGSQVRWLDLELVRTSDSSPTRMSPHIRNVLLERLGKKFEGWSNFHETDPRSGGIISLSPVIYHSGDSVEVHATYRHRTRYAYGPETAIAFTLVNKAGKWTIVDR
jgi:hypothetical protein